MADAEVHILSDYRERREHRHLSDEAVLSQLDMSEKLLLEWEEHVQRLIEQHESLRQEAQRRGIGGTDEQFAMAWSPDDPA